MGKRLFDRHRRSLSEHAAVGLGAAANASQHADVVSESAAWAIPMLIHGNGGVGKSKLLQGGRRREWRRNEL